MSENWRQFGILCIVINYKSRGSIATHLSFDYSERYMTDDSSIVISSASRQTVASDKHQFPRGEVCNTILAAAAS